MHERVVLPRIGDFIDDVLKVIAEARKPGESWEALVLDYADAFKHLHIDVDERKYLAGRALNGCFIAAVLLFGVKPDPLLWGRLAALVMRTTSCTNMDANAALQCYVDDPVLAVGGTEEQRLSVMLRAIILWLILGLKLAWRKGQRGKTGE